MHHKVKCSPYTIVRTVVDKHNKNTHTNTHNTPWTKYPKEQTNYTPHKINDTKNPSQPTANIIKHV
jgi:hypothetical protein